MNCSPKRSFSRWRSKKKTHHSLNLNLVSDQELLLRWLNAKFVRFANKIMRHSVKLGRVPRSRACQSAEAFRLVATCRMAKLALDQANARPDYSYSLLGTVLLGVVPPVLNCMATLYIREHEPRDATWPTTERPAFLLIQAWPNRRFLFLASVHSRRRSTHRLARLSSAPTSCAPSPSVRHLPRPRLAGGCQPTLPPTSLFPLSRPTSSQSSPTPKKTYLSSRAKISSVTASNHGVGRL